MNNLILRQIGRIKMALKNDISLGQHWLKNREILDYIAECAGSGGVCVEIGPGLGTLTSSLLRRFEKVIAVEYDKELARKLPGSFPGTNLEVVNADFLECDLGTMPEPYVVAGNIPYYITTPILLKLVYEENRPERIVLLMQKEVVERIVDPRGSVLALTIKNRADVEAGMVVKAEEFTPVPKVDSQVLILKPHPPIVSEAVIDFIKVGFSQPRKKVTRNLSVLMPREDIKDIFIKMNMNIDVRPHELSLQDWEKIYQKMHK